jgi:hypothetical protein
MFEYCGLSDRGPRGNACVLLMLGNVLLTASEDLPYVIVNGLDRELGICA